MGGNVKKIYKTVLCIKRTFEFLQNLWIVNILTYDNMTISSYEKALKIALSMFS